ncbi:MAG TPA: hypothetical protein VLS96_03530, partial [Nodosilinea sp.]|nr:hypothetical protein [Nodosilinea sp.]
MTLSNSKTSSRFQIPSDALLLWGLRSIACLAGAITVLIVAFLAAEALPILRRVPWQRFLSDPAWSPTQAAYNLLPMIWGTLAVTVGAVVLAVPLGLGSALFCQYYAPP